MYTHAGTSLGFWNTWGKQKSSLFTSLLIRKYTDSDLKNTWGNAPVAPPLTRSLAKTSIEPKKYLEAYGEVPDK